MQGKRRRIAAALKAKVALEALGGEKTTNEIAGKYEVHPNQVAAWKKRLRESAADFFAERRARDAAAARQAGERNAKARRPQNVVKGLGIQASRETRHERPGERSHRM
ncbi:transposase [Candidatus Sumerlaeota bacterium]|nr:transposase [Candidatus Sumerlaeota bacterium]